MAESFCLMEPTVRCASVAMMLPQIAASESSSKRTHTCPSLEPRVPLDRLRDRGPVDIPAFLGDDLQQVIPEQAEQRHRHGEGLCRLADEPHVLETERRRESGGGELSFCENRAVGSKHGSVEEG